MFYQYNILEPECKKMILPEMENLRDSMYREKNNQSFFNMFSLKCFLEFQVEISKLRIWYSGWLSRQHIQVWEELAYRSYLETIFKIMDSTWSRSCPGIEHSMFRNWREQSTRGIWRKQPMKCEENQSTVAWKPSAHSSSRKEE